MVQENIQVQSFAHDIAAEEYRLMANDLKGRIAQTKNDNNTIEFHFRSEQNADAVQEITKKTANKYIKEFITRAEQLEKVPWSLRSYHKFFLADFFAKMIRTIKYRNKSLESAAKVYLSSDEFKKKYEEKKINEPDKSEKVLEKVLQEEIKQEKNVSAKEKDKIITENDDPITEKKDFLDFNHPDKDKGEELIKAFSQYIEKQKSNSKYTNLEENKKMNRIYYAAIIRFPEMLPYIKEEDKENYKNSILNGYVKAKGDNIRDCSEEIKNSIYKHLVKTLDVEKSFAHIPINVIEDPFFTKIMKEEKTEKEISIIIDKLEKNIQETDTEHLYVVQNLSESLFSKDNKQDIEIEQEDEDEFVLITHSSDNEEHEEATQEDYDEARQEENKEYNTNENFTTSIEDKEAEILLKLQDDPNYFYELNEKDISPRIFIEASILTDVTASGELTKKARNEDFIEAAHELIDNLDENSQYLIYKNTMGTKLNDELFTTEEIEEQTKEKEDIDFTL